MKPNLSMEAAYQTFLNDVYKKIDHKAISPDDKRLYQSAHVCDTFGELMTPSVFKLLSKIPLKKDDIFLDLGSGLGRLALTVYLGTSIKKVIGVEGAHVYFAQSQQILEDLQLSLPDLFKQGSLEFVYGNFLDFNFNQASIIYTCSTCFTQELLWLIGDKINQATHVKQVLSLKPIANLERISLKEIIPVECSWDSALCYWYRQ